MNAAAADRSDDLDTTLWDLLEDDLLAVLLTPPRVPSFAAETVRPGKVAS